MKRKSVKKGIAVALAATMTGGVLPAAAVTAAETEQSYRITDSTTVFQLLTGIQ